MRLLSSKPLGYHYERCGIVAASLDLETYDEFSTKQRSQKIGTDADLAEHSWINQGSGPITETEVLHHTKDCIGADCLLCSFEQELIHIGYHERQAARKQNHKRIQHQIIKQNKETAEQNQVLFQKYESLEIAQPNLDDQIIHHVVRSASVSRPRSHSKSGLATTGKTRIVSSISESRICFSGPVLGGFEPLPKVENKTLTFSSPLKKLRQLYRQRRKRQVKEQHRQAFVLRPLNVDKKSLSSPLFLGKVEPACKDASCPGAETTNCKAVWKIDSNGSKLYALDVCSRPKLSERYETLVDFRTQAKAPDESSVEFYFSDDSTPKVLSPEEVYSDGPTPQSSCCNVQMNMHTNEGSTNMNTKLSPDQCNSSGDSPSSPEDYSGATTDQELCFDADFDDDEEAMLKYRARRRALSQSAQFLRESSSRSPTVTETSVIVLDSAKLKRSKSNMSRMYSSTRASTPSHRINSAPIEYPSKQSKRTSPLRCPHTVAASHGLSSFLRQSRRTQEYLVRSPDFFSTSTNGDGNHDHHSVPASFQTTPTKSHPTIRSVRSSPGMKFRTLSPVKCHLTPQSPKCKKKLDFVKGFSPYSVLPCVQDEVRKKAFT